MTALTVASLTESTVIGNGVFDLLMKTSGAHLDAEFSKGRIRGPEYSQVYLGQLAASLNGALQFLAMREKIPLEAELLEQQIVLAQAQIAQTEAQTALIVQQKLNAVTENTVLVAQECKLRAEYDLILKQIEKTTAEITLLNQKTATEKAQVLSTGVDADSIVGRQKGLYLAQTNGYERDAEQKAASILADTWKVRRTTDEGTVADAVNLLNDATVGRAITKLLAGVNA